MDAGQSHQLACPADPVSEFRVLGWWAAATSAWLFGGSWGSQRGPPCLRVPQSTESSLQPPDTILSRVDSVKERFIVEWRSKNQFEWHLQGTHWTAKWGKLKMRGLEKYYRITVLASTKCTPGETKDSRFYWLRKQSLRGGDKWSHLLEN